VDQSGELLLEIRVVQVLDCLADPAKIRVVAEMNCDVQAALPYLAALLPQAGYNHEAGILTVVKDGRLLTVYSRMVTLAKAWDEADARAVLEWLRQRINDVWARRSELTPVHERRRTARLFDVYRLLPGANCRNCGEATCVALASRLIFGEARLGDCPLLAESKYNHNRQLLAEWLGLSIEGETVSRVGYDGN
jgi:ArsR family metal-binding transcriptional regulator